MVFHSALLNFAIQILFSIKELFINYLILYILFFFKYVTFIINVVINNPALACSSRCRILLNDNTIGKIKAAIAGV